VKNATAPETAKLCAQYLGPALRLINFNGMPMPFNAYLRKSPSPENLVYSEQKLAPGGAGASPPEPGIPPAVSAYAGENVPSSPAVQPPPGAPGLYAPNGLPAVPSPALFPNAPIPPGVSAPGPAADPPPPAPAGLPEMLLPDSALGSPAPPQSTGGTS